MSSTSSMRPKPLMDKIVAADEAIDAIAADEADELDNFDEADEAGIAGEADVADLLLPFSHTKFSAFFSEDKVYFGNRVDVRNNKLLMARSRDELDKLVEAKGANNNQLRDCYLSSLITRNQVDNQLGLLAENV